MSGTSPRNRAVSKWVAPFLEVNRYGEPIGERVVRCSACGVEVLVGEEHHVSHRPGCRFRDGDPQL